MTLPSPSGSDMPIHDPLITLYPVDQAPVLLTAAEKLGADLLAKAYAAMESFYGTLNRQQRARLDELYSTPRVNTEGLQEVVRGTRKQVNDYLGSLTGREVDVDSVRIHTSREGRGQVSEPLWAWLSRGTPFQLAQPRLTRDAVDFVDNSWLTFDSGPFTKADGSPVTVDDVIRMNREIDIGQTIATKLDAWSAQSEVSVGIQRESSAHFEITLLNAVKDGRITAEQYHRLNASSDWVALQVERHGLPMYGLTTAWGTYVYADTLPEGKLFLSDRAEDRTAMEVCADEFRTDLWNTRRERTGWSWSLLTPQAQQAVTRKMPQPLPPSNAYPNGTYFVAGSGFYASHAEYQRRASEVRFTAGQSTSRVTVAASMARERNALITGQLKELFTPNQQSSLAHAQRIGLEALTLVLDIILIAVPGEVKFPGRALLFKAMLVKQLVVDLPLNLVQKKWDEVAETLIDFFETLLEMQAVRKAGKILKSRLDKLSRALAPTVSSIGTKPGDTQAGNPQGSDTPISAAQRLRSMLPSAPQGLTDTALARMLRQAGISDQALNAMWRGEADMDMALTAAASESMNRVLRDRVALELATPAYTGLPEAVEWPVVAWLAQDLDISISVLAPDGAQLRRFEPESGYLEADGQTPKREVVLTRYGGWHYGVDNENSDGATRNSLFYYVQPLSRPGQIADNRDRQAIKMRDDTASQLNRPENIYAFYRAIHHGDRPRGSVPAGEGTLSPVSVGGSNAVSPGRLSGADTRCISAESERSVPDANSLENLGKARHQADLAALEGAPGPTGPQALTLSAESLYLGGLLSLFSDAGLDRTVAVRVEAGGRTAAVWGQDDATQMLVLVRRGEDGVFTYSGRDDTAGTVAPAVDSQAPLSDVVLRLMNDRARQAVDINIGDAQRLNKAVMDKVLDSSDLPTLQGTVKGVDIWSDPEMDINWQPVTLGDAPGADGLTRQDAKAWLSWADGALEVEQEGLAWRVISTGGEHGPLVQRSYGEWRRLQEPVTSLEHVVDGPVQDPALLARLRSAHAREPAARVYHDVLNGEGGTGSGASYIAFRGLSTTFYRVKTPEPGAIELQIVRPDGTGGGVWVHQGPTGIWQPARTLQGGMDNADDPLQWRPWVRPGASRVPATLGLIGSRHEATFKIDGARRKALNRFYPFVRPANRARDFTQRLAAAPAEVQGRTDATNIEAKVDLFHTQWQLPIDLTALLFFRTPGETTTEIKLLNGSLIADLVTARRGGQPIVTRVIEPMAGSGLYSNFVRAAGFSGEIRVNDINPLVSWAQREIVAQPDRVKYHIDSIKQTLLEFWNVRQGNALDPEKLTMTFENDEAAREFMRSPEVLSLRDDLRHYFYSTVESQYQIINGQVLVSPESSFVRADPVNGEAEARAYVAAAFYILQNNTVHSAIVKINSLARINLPLSIIVKDSHSPIVKLFQYGLSNTDHLNYLSYLHAAARGRTVFSNEDGWEMLRVTQGESNVGDLAIVSGHFSDVYLSEVDFMEKVRLYVMPFVENRGRVIIVNAYSAYKERSFLELGLRVFVLENSATGYLLVMSDSVARDVGIANA